MVVQHNLIAMNSNRMLGLTIGMQAKSTEKLSSGYKINRAADDAAGLAISEKMRRQIRGLTQAALNCQDGVSLVQTADGALHEVTDMLQRGNELAVKAANGTLSSDDRNYIQSEITAIIDEINKVAERTTFNEIQILKGDDAQPGAPVISGGFPSWASSSSFGAGYLDDVYTLAGTNHASAVIDFSSFTGTQAQLDELSGGDMGFHTTCATCNNHYTINFTTDPSKEGRRTSGDHFIYTVDISNAHNASDITDKILAVASNNPEGHYTKFQKDSNGNLIVYDERSITNITPSNASLGEGVATARGDAPYDIVIQAGCEAGQDIKIKLPGISSQQCGINAVNVRTQSGAYNAIAAFKGGIKYVNGERSRMGAYQNRLEHTIHNLNNVVENTTAAESAIRDTNMSEEIVRLSILNILNQAGQSMLSQANQSNSGVLALL